MKTIRDILAGLLPNRQPSTRRWRQPLLAAALALAAGAATAQPANDNFASATVLTGAAGTTSGDNTLASLEACEPITLNTDDYGVESVTNSVWFAWTATATGNLELDTDTSNPSLDLILGVWTDTSATPAMCDGTLTNVIADDDSFVDGSVNLFSCITNFPVTAGTTYYFEVCSLDNGSSPNVNAGAYVLNWNFSTPVPTINPTVPTGPVQFTANTYIVSQSDSTPPMAAYDGITVSPSVRGARITVTRPAPAYGRILVDYAIFGETYINVYRTNYYGTNVLTEFISTNTPPTITLSNAYSTNMVTITGFQQYDANNGGFYYTWITNFFTNAASLVENVAYQATNPPVIVPLTPIPTDLPYLGAYEFTTNYNLPGFTVFQITDLFGYLQTGRTLHSTSFDDGLTYTDPISTIVYNNYEVFATNTYITNFYGTNILLTYTPTAFFGNYFSTNLYVTNMAVGLVYDTNSIFTNGALTFSTNVFGTNWNVNPLADTASLVEVDFNGSNYLALGSILVPVLPVPTNFPTRGYNPPRGIAVDSSGDIIISVTNDYAFAAPTVYTTNVSGSLEGIQLLTGTVAFSNLQMSADILLPVTTSIGPDAPLLPWISGVVTNVLFNPRLDPAEDPNVLIAPTIAPGGGVATINALSPNVITYNNYKTPTMQQDAAVFNFERSTFRVYRNENNVNGGTATMTVKRSGGNFGENVSVDYVVGPATPPYSGYPYSPYCNTYTLQAGSDYATPNSDYTPVSGTLTFPANSGNASVYQSFSVPILNNGLVEFNEDVIMVLHNPQPGPSLTDPGAVLGQVNEATLTILFDDTIVSGGQFAGQQPAGAVDRSWNTETDSGSYPPFLQYPGTTPGEGGTVYAVAEEPDGTAILAGSFVSYDSTPYNRIVRVLSTGYLDPDPTFFQGNRSDLGNNSGANDFIGALALQPDGRIIIGGNFTSYNGYNRHHVARLNPNGSVDTSFAPGVGANSTVWALALLPNGQVIIGGAFTNFNGTLVNQLARLNPDGSLDTTFACGALGGTNVVVDAVAVDAYGRVLIGGNFISVAGVANGAIARLNPDGSLDRTFTPGIGTYNPDTIATDPVKTIAVQADGRILLGGSFAYFDLVPENGLLRLNPDGTLDLTFASGSGTLNPITGDSDTVNTIFLQPDGNLLIGGDFEAYNQTRRIGFARVFSDGSLDTSFMDASYNEFAGLPNYYFNQTVVSAIYPYYNTRNAVYALALETNAFTTSSNILIGGTFEMVGGGFTRFDMRPRSNVARVIGGATPGPGNLELLYNNYSVANSEGSLYVSMTRTNGNLGDVFATMSVTTPAAGPGVATAGTDFAPSVFTPTYYTVWSLDVALAWDTDVGLYGPNYLEQAFPQLSGGADIYLGVFNPGNITGNLSADFGMSQPTGIFTLGGEYIPNEAALGADMAAPLTIIDSNVKAGVLGFSSPVYSVVEGNTATITLTRTNGSQNQVTVWYATSDGTATNGVDYTGATNQLTFGIGVTSQTFPIATFKRNHNIQPDKTLNLSLFTPGNGATLGLSNAVLTLVNNNYLYGHLGFSQPNYSVNENGGSAVITVNRLGGSSGTLGVTFLTSDSTAANGVNYTGTTNALLWNNGDATSRTITIPVKPDGVVTPNLVANLILTNSMLNGTNNAAPLAYGNAASPTNATLTIVNVDSAGSFQFSVGAYSVQKYGGYALIPVTRTNGSVGTARVTVMTMDDTAFAGTNYLAYSNTLTFASGQVSKLIQIPILDDGVSNNPSGPKDLFVQLSNPTGGATVGTPAPATLYILDSESLNETPGTAEVPYTFGFNNTIYALALQANNQLLVGGDFTMADGVTRNHLARLNADGSLDAGFSLPSDNYGASDSVRTIAVQQDNRIIIGGAFTNFNGQTRGHIARLNFDGTLDSLFNPGSGADNTVYATAQTFVNGVSKVLVGGSFASFSGNTFNGLGQLNDDGTPDTTFNSGGLGANNTVYALAVQADGKVVIGGDFTTYNGLANFNHLARINPDGSADTNFLVGLAGPNASVRALAIQLDGKILIGGLFTNVNGKLCSHISRLNANGTVDGSFIPNGAPGLGANDAVFALGLQSDTRIVVGGEFTSFSGVTRNYITRLNPDGTVDPSINFGTGANNFVAAVAVMVDSVLGYPTNVPDEKLIIGGGFTQYDGAASPYLARIFGGSIGGSGAFQFSSGNYQVDENGTNAVITVWRTGGTTNATTGDIHVTAYTSNGTALAGTNYMAVSTNLDFPLGETIRSFVVPVLNDGLVEPNLTVNLTLTNATSPAVNGLQPTAVLTIIDDNSTVSFSSSAYSVPKNVINGVAPITLVRTGGTNATTTVNFTTTSGGTATPGTDYLPVTQTVVFSPGNSVATVNIPINNNGIAEGNQTVTMQLAAAAGSILVSPTNATLTIIDTVNAPGELSWASPAYAVTEGGGVGYTTLYVTVQRTFGSSGAVSVNFATQDGTATAGLKYVSTNGVLPFGDGETSKSFPVEVFNTATAEGPETFVINLSSPSGNATLTSPSSTVVTILNTNVGIAFASATNSYTEPSGLVPGTVLLNVVRYNNTNVQTTVNFSTTNGSAVAPLDFDSVTNGTLTFNPGDAMKAIAITTHHDTNVTGDLFFTVGLANPSGSAQLTPPTFTWVTDHDADAGISFLTNAANVYRNAGYAIILVSNTNPNVEPVYVNYATGGGSAVAGLDYSAVSGRLSFTNGAVLTYFVVPILLNNSVQTNRSFNVTLSGVTPPGVLYPASLSTETVTIIGTNTPAGLSFSVPVLLGGLWGSTNLDNTFGAPEIGDPSIAGSSANAPVWFEWTAPAGHSGEVTLDTIGSVGTNGVQLDTVLGVYSGGSLSTLNQVAANDDLYPSYPYTQQNETLQNIWNTNEFFRLNGRTYIPRASFLPVRTVITQPFAGPSGLRFTAQAGTTYYIAVDTKVSTVSSTLSTSYSPPRGLIQLNWAYHPAGVFRFATEDVDATGIVDTNGNPMLLYQCAESEGSLSAAELVNNNANVHREIGPFEQQHQYRTTLDAYYYYDVEGLLVTVTRVAGSTGRMLVDYTTQDGDTNLLVNGDVPAVGNITNITFLGFGYQTNITTQDYVPVSGTLIFDDFEMSKTIRIPIIDDANSATGILGSGRLNAGTPQPNRDFMVVLSNPRRDPAESPDVSSPRVDPIFGKVLCRILDCDIDPQGPVTMQTVASNGITGLLYTNFSITDQFGGLLEPTNGIFNFSKANYRVPRDVQGFFNGTPVTVYVNRAGTNRSSVTVHYRFDNYAMDNNSVDDPNNDFPLQAGSDYATPTPATTADIFGTNSDFAGVGGDSGTLTFPGGTSNPFQSQPIHFTVNDNQVTEFNKDIHITIYELDANGNPFQPGMVAETTVTILFDDTAPPAGSVDEFYSPDFAESLALLNFPPNFANSVLYPGASADVHGVIWLTNNESIIAGAFSTYSDMTNNAQVVNGIARLYSNGELDTNFSSGAGINVHDNVSYIQSLALTPNNQIVIGGNFTSYNNQRANDIARLNANGTLDTTFATGAGFNGMVWSVLVQPDGKVLAGGNFTTYGGTPCNYIVRLNTDGSLDTTFNVSNLLSGPVKAMALTPQGGVVIGGVFAVAGHSYANIARLNSDGSLDTSFGPGTGANGPVLVVAVQPDNKVILGGSFQSFNGLPFNNLARLNPDGSIDSGYNNGTGTDNQVVSLTLDPATTNLYVGGSFTVMNGTHRLGFARLYPDGTVDTTFLDTAYNQYAGLPRIFYGDAAGTVYASALQGDGNVLIGGSFKQVGGGQASAVARLVLEEDRGLYPSTYDTNLWVSYGGGSDGDLEPKSRDGVRNRSNIARLIGGATPGPGNIGMVNSSYSVAKNQFFEPVTLVRANGLLGYASANFAVLPGLAKSGVDYAYQSPAPLYPIDWEYMEAGINPTRMHSDGFQGANGLMLDFFGQSWRPGLSGPASANVTIYNNPASSGNLTATFQMANPSGADQFYLGGQNIPLGVALGQSTAPLTVVDNTREDGVFGFTAGSYVASNSPVMVTIARTNGTSGSVQMNYQTVTNGSTAVANVDYTPAYGLVTFASAQTSGSFPVTILNNSSVSSQEKTVNVQLYNLQDLSGGNAQFALTNAAVRIINPNYPGFLNFSTNNYYVNLSAGVVNLTVTRSVGSKGTATVQYRTADGSATNGINYAGSTNTLTWNSGDVSPRTVSIPLININTNGRVLSFTANLFNPTLNGTNASALLGATTLATVYIINDDTFGTFQFSSPSYQFNDGSNALATITVIRTISALGTASVNYTTANGTALAGTNYVGTNGILTFTNGQLARSFTVRLLDDGSTNDPTPANFYFFVDLYNQSSGAHLNLSFTNAAVHLVHAEQYNQPPGSVDPSFGAGANASVLALALQSDGQVVAGGSFTVADGTSRNRLARFNTDGSLDDTFLLGLSGANNTVNALVSQTDDRILVGGAFDQMDGVNSQHVVRLMTDGSLDTSFSPGSAADNTVYALAESFINGGRVIYVGGAFANFESVASPGVVRLNNNGAVDASFAVAGGVSGTVYALAVYPTNSISYAGDVLVGGAFTNFNGASVGNLVRLNANGSLDTNFNQNALANGPVRALAIQLDGSVLIGGEFTNVNGVGANNLARLTPTGALDTGFTAAAAPGINGAVNCIVLQQDNGIVVGGQFNYGNGVTRNDFTRLLPSGAVDPTINFGSGANGAVNAVVIQPTDGNLVIGGGFTQFNGQSCDHIARLFGGSALGSGTFQFTSAYYQVDENGSFASITIERLGGTSGTNANGSGSVSVAFATADGSAKAGTNYSATTNYVTFPAGEVLETVYVPVRDDGVITTNLTVNLSLSNPTAGSSLGDQSAALLTIINDDSAVEFSQPNYPLQIAANGFANIPVVRYGSASGSCTVNFATTTNGSAVIGTDYYPTNASLTFAPGVLTNIVQVPVLYDTNVFGVTVTMMLTNALNTLLASPSNAVLNLSESSTNPGNLFFASTNFGVYANAGVALLPVLRTNGNAGPVSVYYTTVPVTAVPGVDYTPVTNELQFSDQDTLEYCRIPVIDNLLAQTPVRLQVYLFSPSGAGLITPTNTTLVISNNTAVFAFAQVTNTVAENQGPVSLVVQRFNNSSIVSSVNYATTTNLVLPGINNAVAGTNFATTAGTLTFGVGETLKSISVPVFNRSNYMTVAFGMNLFSPTNAQLVAPTNAVVFITPAAAGVSFTTNAASVLNSAGYLAVPVLCSNPGVEPAGNPLTVNYTTLDGSAKAGYNYNSVSGTLFFTNGLVTNTIYVPILNTQFLSSNLTFSVILTNVTPPGVLAPYATQTVSIVEGLAGMSFSQANYNVPKTSALATITVNRTGFTNSVASVDYFVTNGTAIGGQNFYPTNGTLRFTNGVISQSFNVALIANTLVQPNLVAQMALLNATNAQIVNPGDATLTILEAGSSYVIPAGALLTGSSSLTNLINDVIGSNDTVNVQFAFRDAAGQNVTNLVAVLLATNGVTAPNPVAQVYSNLTVYGHSVSRPFSFTAQGTNTYTIAPTFLLFDSNTVSHAGKYIGPATFVFTIGTWTTTFANTNRIIIYDNAAASPYPSPINVSGVGNTLIKATVTLTNLSHQDLSDVSALVVSPSTNTLIMSGVGASFKAAHLNLTFDDWATNSLPMNGTILSGTNKPTQISTPTSFP